MVRLKGGSRSCIRASRSHFNSTMVRLKAVEAQSLQQAPVFQFHYGTIKSFGAESKLIHIAYFNSTMVRLKDRRPDGFRKIKGISIPLWYD